MKLDQLLRQSSLTFGDRPAIIDQDRSINYRQLGEAAGEFAEQLRRLPIDPGSRFALLMENCVDYAIAYFGVLEAGFVVVPLDTSANGETLGYILDNCEVRVLIAQSRYRRQLKSVFDGGCGVEYLLCDSTLAVGPPALKKMVFGDSMKLDSDSSDA